MCNNTLLRGILQGITHLDVMSSTPVSLESYTFIFMTFLSAPPLPSFRKLPSTPPYFRKLFVKQPIWQSPPLSTSNTSWLLTDKLQINSHPNEVLIKKIPTPWTFPNLLETGNIFETLWWWKLIYNFCWTVSHVVLCQERGVSNIWRQGFSTCQTVGKWSILE